MTTNAKAESNYYVLILFRSPPDEETDRWVLEEWSENRKEIRQAHRSWANAVYDTTGYTVTSKDQKIITVKGTKRTIQKLIEERIKKMNSKFLKAKVDQAVTLTFPFDYRSPDCHPDDGKVLQSVLQTVLKRKIKITEYDNFDTHGYMWKVELSD